MKNEKKSTIIHWFRLDLRISDNAAFKLAFDRSEAVLPVYIYDEDLEAPWRLGGASRWWLHHALMDLKASLIALGLDLYIFKGNSAAILKGLINHTKAHTVTWSRRYEPHIVAHDRLLKADLQSQGIEVLSFNSSLLFEPHTVLNKSGQPFQVFTPFWKHCQNLIVGSVVVLESSDARLASCGLPCVAVDDLGLLPKLNWADSFSKTWKPQREAGLTYLKDFLCHRVADYKINRDFPALKGTSSLSPYLHFGQIGPREVVALLKKQSPLDEGALCFYSELGWREFAYHLLWYFPHTSREPLRACFKHFPWQENKDWIKAWQRGETGYPIIDAGMRQLWQTGTLHNRVRMIVASFLVKNLLQHWHVGADWFWDTLVDADLASNSLGWQWSAGCGADAAPYFRIFNPVLQGEKFDAYGDYVRHYLPELQKIPNRYLHCPWEASATLLSEADIVLGKTYPKPLLLPNEGRQQALSAYAKMKSDF